MPQSMWTGWGEPATGVHFTATRLKNLLPETQGKIPERAAGSDMRRNLTNMQNRNVMKLQALNAAEMQTINGGILDGLLGGIPGGNTRSDRNHPDSSNGGNDLLGGLLGDDLLGGLLGF